MVTTAPGTTAAAPARTAVDRARTGTRLRTLDGLRFVAALGVMLYHFTTMWSTAWGDDQPGERWPLLGRVAVYFVLAPEMFFVLSGFVILWTAWGRTVPAVIASRVARIYPAYWAALALTSVLLLAVWPQGKAVSLSEVAVNVTLLQEAVGVRHVDGVYWTLWTELRFYALIVVLVALGLTRRRLLVFCALWPAVGGAAHLAGWDILETVLVGQYAPMFAGGMLLYLIYRDGHGKLPWALVGLNVALGMATTVPGHIAALERVTVFAASPVVMALVLVACFASVALFTLTRLRDIDWPLLTSLGNLTYPMYLVHLFWGLWVIQLLQGRVPDLVALAAAFGLSLALAAVVHHGVEKRLNPPMRRWLERGLSRTPASRRDAPAPATLP